MELSDYQLKNRIDLEYWLKHNASKRGTNLKFDPWVSDLWESYVKFTISNGGTKSREVYFGVVYEPFLTMAWVGIEGNGPSMRVKSRWELNMETLYADIQEKVNKGILPDTWLAI
jgi:hypothetical protein